MECNDNKTSAKSFLEKYKNTVFCENFCCIKITTLKDKVLDIKILIVYSKSAFEKESSNNMVPFLLSE